MSLSWCSGCSWWRVAPGRVFSPGFSRSWGVVLGVLLGSRLAPLLVPENESLVFRAGVTLASILAFAVLGDVVARAVGRSIRSRLRGLGLYAAGWPGRGGAGAGALADVGVGGRAVRAPGRAARGPPSVRKRISDTTGFERAYALAVLYGGRLQAGPATPDPGSPGECRGSGRGYSRGPGSGRGSFRDGPGYRHSLRLRRRGLRLGLRPRTWSSQTPTSSPARPRPTFSRAVPAPANAPG